MASHADGYPHVVVDQVAPRKGRLPGSWFEPRKGTQQVLGYREAALQPRRLSRWTTVRRPKGEPREYWSIEPAARPKGANPPFLHSRRTHRSVQTCPLREPVRVLSNGRSRG